MPALREQFGYKNVMEVPKVTKVTLNMGIGEGTHDAKAMEEAALQLGLITGQKAQCAGPASRWPTSSCVRACRWGCA